MSFLSAFKNHSRDRRDRMRHNHERVKTGFHFAKLGRRKTEQVAMASVAGVILCAALPAHAALVISTAASQNVICSAGVCAPTAKDAVLNVTDLENLLASGDVAVTTSGSGGVQANNIRVSTDLSWSNQSVLGLDAFDSIAINEAIAVDGAGGVALSTNDGGRNGMLSFGKKGRVEFQSLASSITINGAAFTLVNSISTLATTIASNPGGNYALANDYDASQDGVYSNSPITTQLTGVVQGLGNTISNLSIQHQGRADIGLFADVDSTGFIANMRLKKLNLTGQKNLIGGLVGRNFGSLSGNEAQGAIYGKKYDGGGLVGANYGTISNGSADVHVQGIGVVGGLVAYSEGTINLSHASGRVSGTVAGGLVGENAGNIDQSYATGAVKGYHPGGLAGYHEVTSNPATISNSYSTGSVTGVFGGGLVNDDANSSATIVSSYSTGAVSVGAGGFVCEFVTDTFTTDYWDTTSSGTTNATCTNNLSGITGLTTEQLQSGLPDGFDPAIWVENANINNGLPYLIANPPMK